MSFCTVAAHVVHPLVPEQTRVRQDLLNYCERDTWAMVKVLARVRELASTP